MSIDIEKLKARALAAKENDFENGSGLTGEFLAFMDEVTPDAVLDLIAEVERLSQDAERYRKIKADNKRSADSTFCLFLDSGGNLLPVASMDMDNEIDVAIEEGRDNT